MVFAICYPPSANGAGDGIRTHNLNLGKILRYRCATPACNDLLVRDLYSGCLACGQPSLNSLRQLIFVHAGNYKQQERAVNSGKRSTTELHPRLKHRFQNTCLDGKRKI